MISRILSLGLASGLFCACGSTTALTGFELVPTRSTTRTIAAGGTHNYRTDARQGDLVRIVAVQKGADIKIRVRDGSGTFSREVDEPDIRFATEQLTFVAPSSGRYVIEIVATGVATSGNTYELTLTKKRSATEADRDMVRGEEAYYRALLLMQERGGSAAKVREALPALEEALKFFRAASYRYGESRALAAQAAAVDDLEDFRQGRPLVLEAIAIQRADGDRLGLVRSLQELSWAAINFQEQKQAVQAGREGIALAEELGLRDSEADLRNTVGIALRDLADRKGAQAELERAAVLFADVGDLVGEGRARVNLAGVMNQLGQTKEAMALLERAAELQHAANSAGDESYAIMSLGHLYMSQGDTGRAISQYERGLALGERVHNQGAIAQGLHNLGVANSNRGEFARGLELNLQAQKIYRSSGDRYGDAQTAQSIGRAYYHLGRYRESLDQYDYATKLFEKMDTRVEDARVFIFIGQVYEDLGEAAKAREWYSKVIDPPAPRSTDVLDALIRLAALDVVAADYESARRRIDGALMIARKSSQAISEADALLVLGDLERQRGNTQAALEHYSKARDFYAKSGIRSRSAIAAFRLGSATEQSNDLDAARRLYADAVQVAREARTPVIEGLALSRLMTLEAATSPRVAIFYGKQSVNVFQRLRGNIATLERETQRRFVQTKAGSYRTLAEILITLGRLGEARQVLDLLKEEEYFEFVRRDRSQATAETAAVELTPEERGWESRYREIGDRITAIGLERGTLVIKRMRTAEEDQRLAALDADLQVAGRAFQDFLIRLSGELAANPSGASRALEVRDAQGLMETLRDLGPGVVALYTIMGADKYRVILVTPDAQKAAEYSISAAELNARIFAMREAVENPLRDPRPAAHELYKILVGPIERDLSGARAQTLMWSLDGALRYVPISALYDGRQFLVERYRTVMITPASNSRLKDEPSAQWSVLGLAVSKAHESFPALPGAVREIQQIVRSDSSNPGSGLLEGKAMVDEEFTAQTMTTELRRRYPVVHIASHFSFQPGNEESSFLLLGDGGRLSLAELKGFQNLFSGVDLLTLSACNTASGGAAGADGREVEGFGVIAQRQGAKAVLATLWPVSDASTPMLMRQMYERRTRGPATTKIEALRQAQIAMLRASAGARVGERRGLRPLGGNDGAAQAKYQHPYYWAPFVLIGNWR